MTTKFQLVIISYYSTTSGKHNDTMMHTTVTFTADLQTKCLHLTVPIYCYLHQSHAHWPLLFTPYTDSSIYILVLKAV